MTLGVCYECGHSLDTEHTLTIGATDGIVWGATCVLPECKERRKLNAFRYLFPAVQYPEITDAMMQEFKEFYGRGGCQYRKEEQ